MKSILKSACLLVFSLTSIHLQAGDKVGNGGDAIASEFSVTAGRIYRTFNQVCVENKQEEACENIVFLKRSILRASVTVKEKVFAEDGEERDAINDGESKIVIGLLRWEKLTNRQKVLIIVHEHLSLLKIEQSDQYMFTNEIVNLIEFNGWDIGALCGNPSLIKTYSGLSAMVVVNNKLVPVIEDPTSALGFCVLKGFKNAVSFTVLNTWGPFTYITPTGQFYGYSPNSHGRPMNNIVCAL
ncbi:MAG: hypothetical protein ACOYL6_08505 [Bacteriovoracaceae bacterium]